jgi:hypothetical protein
MLSWRGDQLKPGDNFTFTIPKVPTKPRGNVSQLLEMFEGGQHTDVMAVS